ncbi:MAG: anti-sigma factor [Gemmatimonadota bacterium]
MNPHEWFVVHRTEFVIRTLEPGDERTFAEHLPGCAECREEIGRIEHDLAWLPMGASPAVPRPGLKRRLLEGALGSPVRRWRWTSQWPAIIGIAASLLLGLGLYAREHARSETLTRQVAQLDAALRGAQDTLSIIRGASRVLQASFTMDGHNGGMTIFADSHSHRWNVVVHGLPAAPAGEVYQFWFICDNGMIRGVTVHLDEKTPAFMTLPMPEAGGTVLGAALTVELDANTAPEPQGKTLAHLML